MEDKKHKILEVLGVPYEAEKIIKKDNNIKGYIEGSLAWEFPNISNLDDCVLLNGATYDEPEDLKNKFEKIESDKIDIQLAIAELAATMMGGIIHG